MGERVPHLYSVDQLSYFQKQVCCLQNMVLILIYQFGQCVIPFRWILKTCCDISSLMPFPQSFSMDFKSLLLSKCNIDSLMLFLCSFSLDTISMKRQKVPMDAKDMFYFHPSISHQ